MPQAPARAGSASSGTGRPACRGRRPVRRGSRSRDPETLHAGPDHAALRVGSDPARGRLPRRLRRRGAAVSRRRTCPTRPLDVDRVERRREDLDQRLAVASLRLGCVAHRRGLPELARRPEPSRDHLHRRAASGGRRSCQSVACWNVCAARSTVSSSNRLPTRARPTGRPSTKPQGTLTTGAPTQLQGELNGIRLSRYGQSSPAELDGLLADLGRHNRHRRRGQQVDLAERSAEALVGKAARSLAEDVDGWGQQEAGQKPSADVLTVVGQPLRSHWRCAAAASVNWIACWIVPSSSKSGSPTSENRAPAAWSSSSASRTTATIRASMPRSKQRCDDADAKSRNTAARVATRTEERGPRIVDGSSRIRPGDDLEQQRTVLGRACDRADRVERPAHGHDAAVRDPARRRPDPGDAAEGGRDPDRAGRVRSERSGSEIAPRRQLPSRRSIRRRSDRSTTGSAPGRSAGLVVIAP